MITERYAHNGQTWSISYDEARTTLVIVENGLERVERFEKSGQTYQRFSELTSAKTREGWTLVEQPLGPVTHHARNAQLEVRLLEDPFDQQAWCVYGGWLQQQGDPRGEYIALRAAWVANPYDQFAARRLWACHRRHADYFGGLPNRVDLGMGGFQKVIALTQHTVETLTAPELRFVTEVHVASSIPGAVDHAISSKGPHLPPTVRTLSIWSRDEVAFEPLQAVLDRLHELRLSVPSEAAGFDELATRPWRHLKSLTIDATEAPFVRPTALLGCELPSLTTLWFSHLQMDAELMSVIAQAPYANKLKVLGLMFLDDGAAKVLLENIGRFPALTELIVDDLRMTPEVNQQLWSALRSRGVLKFLRSNLVSYPE